ncbi:unnamed protein product [Ceutorhynchus assimilis]|uniref:Uncharacterized protein n=1 Tax=Ceutorhynchus assimilis TaxID=467358 RepID=A0A9N9QLX3_9CUCU|nr:unnamed protein product [Ceutorhynchus assimilis]
MRKAREENKETKIKGFKLEIDGQQYSANELDDTSSITGSSSNKSGSEDFIPEEAVEVYINLLKENKNPTEYYKSDLAAYDYTSYTY